MSDIRNFDRRAIVSSRKARTRRELSNSELWRGRYLYPWDLDDLGLSDGELFARFMPLAACSNPKLAEGMRETFYSGTLESYPAFVLAAEGCTPLSAFFARARLWTNLDFDAAAVRLVSELPDVSNGYAAFVTDAIRELVDAGGFVPPGYAAPLAMALVDADTIVAAYLDRVPLEYAELLGKP